MVSNVFEESAAVQAGTDDSAQIDRHPHARGKEKKMRYSAETRQGAGMQVALLRRNRNPAAGSGEITYVARQHKRRQTAPRQMSRGKCQSTMPPSQGHADAGMTAQHSSKLLQRSPTVNS